MRPEVKWAAKTYAASRFMVFVTGKQDALTTQAVLLVCFFYLMAGASKVENHHAKCDTRRDEGGGHSAHLAGDQWVLKAKPFECQSRLGVLALAEDLQLIPANLQDDRARTKGSSGIWISSCKLSFLNLTA